MPIPASTAEALQRATVQWRADVPLSKRTWWRVGGTADGLVVAEDLATLSAVAAATHQTGCPLFVLGNASNLLVSDRGIRGLVVRLAGDLATAQADDSAHRVVLGGGTKLVSLVRRMGREGWTGLEFLAGIPGTIGGAVRMNAGTRLGEVADALVDVRLVLRDGATTTRCAADLGLVYRASALPEGSIVAAATFSTTQTEPEKSRRLIEEHLAYRARTQPVDVPTCGSTFRNPPGDHAGRLIEAAGLKGVRIGAAEVSTKHANFLVNTGDATAADLRALIEHVHRTVEERFGIALEREVHYAGDWSGWSADPSPPGRHGFCGT